MASEDVRRFDEPRQVEVWHDGWVRWPSGEWRASVSFVVEHDWGRGKYLRSVPADEVRLVE